MPQSSLDLASVFGAVTRSLAENQGTLNHADEFNQDHGDNMVQTFRTITEALQQKKGSSTSTALSYAARRLTETGKSSSSKLYAENLSLAAAQLKGKTLDLQGLLQLLQTLIGGGKAGGGDLLGSLLGGLLGGGQASKSDSQASTSSQKPKSSSQKAKSSTSKSKSASQKTKRSTQKAKSSATKSTSAIKKTTSSRQKTKSTSQRSKSAGTTGSGGLLGSLVEGMGGGKQKTQSASSGGGELLGSILGGLAGGGEQVEGGSTGGGLLGSLLGGLAGGGQQGDTQGLISAFMGSSGMGDTSHRTQSTQIVVDSFLKALGG